MNHLVRGEPAACGAVGFGLGISAAVMTSKFLTTLLYGLQAKDPVTYVVAAIILAGIGTLAG